MQARDKRHPSSIICVLILFCTGIAFSFCGQVKRPTRQEEKAHRQPSELVYPFLDAANSRWFFFNSASRPFGMVNVSPDTQIDGAWGSGYRYHTDTVKGISHIHAWQLAGLSIMPVIYDAAQPSAILSDYYSAFDHERETAAPGYHSLHLDRYGIEVELTCSKRAGFHKYRFPAGRPSGMVLNLGGKLGPSLIRDGQVKMESPTSFSGELTNAPTIRRPRDCKVFFYAEANQELELSDMQDEGKFLIRLKNNDGGDLLLKVAISYTSVENAKINLGAEIDHWDFEALRRSATEEWNDLLGRISVEGGTESQRRRFYTDLWHALQGRRVISDVNGAYPDNTGSRFRIGQIPLEEQGRPAFNHYNSDSFWGAQWTINTLWGLAYPDIYEEFVRSLLLYYQDGGLVPRGPSGGNYTYVMTGASSTPFVVSAIQKGLGTYNEEAVFEALKKNHMPGGIMARAGYEHATAKGGGLDDYIRKGYVPYPNPDGKFGFHQDGASLTLEYAYQDWTLAQLAKRLNRQADYDYFLKRSENYKNQFDPQTGWMRPKDVSGQWRTPFDPYEYESGFNESNGAQSTWFVPHDPAGLAALMGGPAKAVEKLQQQFEQAAVLQFTAGNSHDQESHPEYRRIPINYGNQPSMQTLFIFHELGRPDLNQYWMARVVEKVYSGLSPETGYSGDEDQGLMGSLAVLLKTGLFQMSGGTEADPVYLLGSPVFDKVTIHLHEKYYPGKKFEIIANEQSENHEYIRSATFNGKKLQNLELRHQDIIKGGKLELEMSGTP